MIKKVRNILFIFMVMIIFPSPVFAVSSDCSKNFHEISEGGYDFCVGADGTEHNVIYSVEEMSINNSRSEIIFKGFAFIEHQHNKGGVNLFPYLVAYVGGWKDEYMYKNTSKNYLFEIVENDETSRDMTQSRCTSVAHCTSYVPSANTYDPQKLNGQCSDGSYSYCLYNDVDFKFKVSLEKLADLIVSDSDVINFRIVLIDEDGSKTSKGDFWADFGVAKEVCTNCNFQNNKSDSYKVETDDYELEFDGVSNEVTIASLSIPRTLGVGGGNAMAVNQNGMHRYFKSGSSYKYRIVRVTGEGDFWSWTRKRMWQDKVYQIASCTNEPFGKYVYPDGDSNCNSDKDFYAYGSWLDITGNLTIRGLTKKIIKKNCSDFFGTETVEGQMVNCGESKDYKQCISKTIEVNDRIYFPTDSTCSGYKITTPDGAWYELIDLSTDILIHQNASFGFGDLSDKVYAGKGIELGATTYKNTVTWVNANWTHDGIAYYNYSTLHQGNGCSMKIKADVYANTMVIYKYANGDEETMTLSEASALAIDEAVQELIQEENVNNISFKSCDSSDSSNCDIANPNYDVKGQWGTPTTEGIKKYESNVFISGNKLSGRKLTNEFNYSLADSYVMVAGETPGKAKYVEAVNTQIEKYVSTGNKFYVDFKWIYNKDLPFDLDKDLNPSLIDGMDWTLNGTCDVKVEDSYYKDASGDGDGNDLDLTYRYRSINVSDPFPKAGGDISKIALNWRDWYSNNNNKIRIENSYNSAPYYQITLSKTGNNGVKISDINSISNHYIDTSGLELDGSSKFVIDNFSLPSVKSFCKLGELSSSSCDEIYTYNR